MPPRWGLLLGTNSFYRHIAPLGLLFTVIDCHRFTLSGFLFALVQPGGNAQAKTPTRIRLFYQTHVHTRKPCFASSVDASVQTIRACLTAVIASAFVGSGTFPG